MKKTLILIWSISLFLITVYLMLSNVNTFKNWRVISKFKKQTESIAHLKNDNFCISKLDSLLIEQPYILLGIGRSDCSACDFILLSKVVDKFPLSRYYIDKQKHESNNLVAQALYSSGTPDAYIVDKDKNLIGRLKSNIDLYEMLDGIINKRSRFCDAEIEGVAQENVMNMFNLAFKSLLAYLSGDMEGIYANAHASKREGEYFFNNYMLYKYHESTGHQDSVRVYKGKAINHVHHGVDVLIYRSLIEEIDPECEKLQLVQ